MYKDYIKRCLDFFIAFVALCFVGWFILLVAILLYFANKGAGAFFFQERPGKDGKPFKLIKFNAEGLLLPDVERLTKVGRLVRSLSIDELPQFINVLKGDMSLIGPRPLLMHYLPWYTPEQNRRHEVRPGITGWAQVNGRNHCKLSRKFELDVWYVDHCNLKTDIEICVLTILNIIKRKDVGEGTGNMEEVDDLGFHERYLQLLEERKRK